MPLRAILLVGFAFLAFIALAADAPPPPIQLEPKEGEAIKGNLLNPTIQLKTPYGKQDVDVQIIQRITFSPGDTPGHDVIEFTDGNHVRGEIITAVFRIETQDSIVSLSMSGIREIKSDRKVELGLWAIILGLLTLTAMEIVLGIDNIIFLAIVAGKLPEKQQPSARRIGLVAALGTRILLLFSLSFLLGLTKPLFTIPEIQFFHDLEAREVSLRDLILLTGGLFLLYKSVKEMHEKLEAARAGPEDAAKAPQVATFTGVLIQIAVLDIVFSLDSVITAVGMVDQVWVMIVAMVIAMLVMMAFAGRISAFVSRHPTIKVLALSFLILIGVMLVAESLGQHINKGYIYFAMAFAVGIEMINMRVRKSPKAKVEAKPS